MLNSVNTAAIQQAVTNPFQDTNRTANKREPDDSARPKAENAPAVTATPAESSSRTPAVQASSASASDRNDPPPSRQERGSLVDFSV